MLGDKPAMANIAVKDMEIAKGFYEGILGLTKIREDPSGRAMYKTGDMAIFVYPSEFAGTNKADYIAWEVGEDFTEIITKLKKAKVVFKNYADMFHVRFEDNVHIMGDMGLVWIEDPDGNSIVISGTLAQ